MYCNYIFDFCLGNLFVAKISQIHSLYLFFVYVEDVDGGKINECYKSK